jgi:hypothetical protein
MTPSGFEHVYSSSDEDDGIVNPIIRHFYILFHSTLLYTFLLYSNL